MKNQAFLAVTLLAFTTLSPAQTTAVPGFISYQGRVVDGSGNNVGTGTPVNRTVIFRIWDNPSSTNAINLIYSEAQTVTVSEGEFSVLVGQGVANTTQTFGYSETAKKLADLAAAFDGSTRFLGVTVAATGTIATTDNEITPRQQIVSTAFAMRSKVAENVVNDSIGTSNISNSSITLSKMAPSSVNSASIVDGSIATADLANASVSLAKLATNSVDSSKIVDGSIALADLASNSVNSSKIVDGSITLADLASNSVDSSKIVNGSIASADLANGSVTAAKLGSDVGTWSATGTTRFYNGGPIGIGTSNPVRGKLEVIGSAATKVSPISGRSYTSANFYTEFFDGIPNPAAFLPGQPPTISNGTYTFSIYADGRVCSAGFYAISDERIKRIEGRSDGARDLESLLEIEVTDYSFIDTFAKGAGKQKKVIAQQVEKVFPQAVSQSTDVVPDIYQKAAINNGWVRLATDLKVGERVRLLAEADEGVYEVLEIGEDSFRTAFKPTADRVFVYGREVTDFRAVDYEAIAMLNVSATQALKREKDAEVKTLHHEVTLLKNQNKALRDLLAAQEIRLTAMHAADKATAARLAAIEKLLEGADTPVLRAVSLTNAE